LEVVLPIKPRARDLLLYGIVNFKGCWGVIKDAIRIARGRFRSEWELKCFPESDPAGRRVPMIWARTLLIGHGLIVGVSIYFHQWLVPVLFTFAPFYGGWLQSLINNTQHIGLCDNVPDFRLCCRTCYLNPLFKVLYWHMNYHTEHHMYPTVPCYNLRRLHAAIRHDLPQSPRGLIATWREIAAILRRQRDDPTYQYIAPCPPIGKPEVGATHALATA
jgi:fatty acid desaturase